MRNVIWTALAVFWLMLLSASTRADGPADNKVENVRRIPKLGVEPSAEKAAALREGLKQLRDRINQVRSLGRQDLNDLLPDVEIFHKAVNDALVYQEFFDPKEIDFAAKLLEAGTQRAEQLANGRHDWTTATGLVVRGYVSKIDGSVQPYGLVVPASYNAAGPGKFRCDVWLHGRGETLSEGNFLRDRMNNVGQISPVDTLVLHPYGRYCNANKFAGEVDVLEALDSVAKRYRIDDQRIAMRGFSMGGAGAWQLAVHYPDQWFAATPGAGFSETPEFLRVFQKEELKPTWFEQRLWRLYDCPYYAENLKNVPTIAYSGELDTQKQAADVMEAACAKVGINLRHIIGPGTRHSIHPAAKAEIELALAALPEKPSARAGGINRIWTTPTLRYNKCYGVEVLELTEHWQPGRIAVIHPQGNQLAAVGVSGIEAFRLHTLEKFAGFQIYDGQNPHTALKGNFQASDGSYQASAHRAAGKWVLGPRPADGKLRKKHGLQGPIDDAFMDSFLFVKPTGAAWNESARKWAQAELERAIEHWRRHFRGVARVKNDVDVTQADLDAHHIVVWGDPGSNQLLAKLVDKLPISWTKEAITVGAQKFPASDHALIAVYPNPLHPYKYVVLNSSFTFRDYAYLNNARQVPMLPDWAVVDLKTPPSAVWPGKIAAADFFDERWELKQRSSGP